MKLAMFVLASLLAAGSARADDLNPPSGPVHVDDPAPVLVNHQAPAVRDPAVRQQRRAERQAFRQMLLQRFDHNGDGKLEPRERKQAIRALRQMARQLARQERRAEREGRIQRRVIRKYDLDGDGNVDPNEMPPGMARRMRRMDRNGDGWVDQADAP
jgi:hypothetical protein